MASIYDWSTTASNNANADSGINWQENQAAASVNNSARAMMGRFAEFLKDLGCGTATTGSANAYLLSSNSVISAYADGQVFGFTASFSNTSTATLSVNSIGAKPIYANAAVLIGGEIVSGGAYLVAYDTALNGAAGGWHLLNPKNLTLAATTAGTITVTDNSNYALSVTQAGNGGGVKITNSGSGNTLLVEDAASTDSTPFAITATGAMLVGAATAAATGGGTPKANFVGDGTSHPAALSANVASAVGPVAVFLKSRNATYGSFTIVQNGDALGELRFYGDDGVDYASLGATIKAEVDGTPGAGDMPTRLVFLVSPDGTETPVEAMRISSTGQIRGTASTTARAPWNFPPGTAPTSPTSGDFWTTSSGPAWRTNGITHTFTDMLATLADLSVVAGDTFYGSASGTVSRLAKGTDGQVYKLASGIPSWASLAVSDLSDAGLQAISSWTYASAVSSVDFTGLSGYKEIIAIFDGVSLDGSGGIRLRTSADNGSAFAATGYESIVVSVVTAGNSNDTAGVLITRDGAAGRSYDGKVEITGLNIAAEKTEAQFSLRNGTTDIYYGSGHYDTARTENAIRFTTTAGDFDAGTIRLYGRK